MTLKLPALDPASLTPYTGSGYPEPFRSRVLPREKRRLGQALGLQVLGVNLTTLPPGKESSMRHWHSHEEEFVFVLAGELVVRTDAGEQLLVAGTCAGFPVPPVGSTGDGHQLVNRGSVPAVYLEVGSKDERDAVHYSDDDLRLDAPTSSGRFTHKDGTPY